MTFLRTHRIAFLTAIFVGLVAVAPSILGPLSLGSEYRGIQYLPFSDDVLYLARIHEVLDGHILVSSPYLYEYKSDPMIVLPLNEWFYALPAYLFGLSAAVTGSKFLLPAALFFLVYFFVRKLTQEKRDSLSLLTSLAAGLAVSFGSDMVDYQYVFSLFSGTNVPHALLWTRLVNPVLGCVLLLTFLISLWHLWERKWRFSYIVAGVVLASMVGYFFAFGMALAILAALFCVALVRKEYDIVRNTLYVSFISFILDAWWWYNTLFSVSGSSGRALAERNGMFFTHAPHLNKALLAATLFVLISFAITVLVQKRREDTRRWLFLFVLLGGGWIAFNQQIITGREIWYHHFVQYTVPLSMIACIVALYLLLRHEIPRVLAIAMIMISAVCATYGLVSVMSYASRLPDLRMLQKYASVLTWLEENAPKDCVVLSSDNDDLIKRLVPAYTSCNTYTTTSVFFGITPQRVEHNVLLQMRLDNVDPENASPYLIAHEDVIRGNFFSDWDQIFGNGEEPWIAEKRADLEKKYRVFAVDDLEKEIRSYRDDYIVSDGPLSKDLLRKLPGLSLATTTGNSHIYSF